MLKLSEQLQQDHDSGDSGQSLEGYPERAKTLEDRCDYLSSELQQSHQREQLLIATVADITRAHDNQNKAINFALDYAIDGIGGADDVSVFLSSWREGDWKYIEDIWPDFDLSTAPGAVE